MLKDSERKYRSVALVAFAMLSVLASRASEGFLEADGCTHYQFARFAFAEPHYFVNIWGRPFCTALYSIPAQIADRFGVRCTSLLLAIAIAYIARAIARGLKLEEPIPALAFLFTLAQPLVFLHSFSELTELPFAMLLGLTFLAYQRRRWMLFAIVASILPLARPEGFVLLALAAIALCARDRLLWILVLPIPLIIWSYVGWRAYGSPPEYSWVRWLPENWPYAQVSLYKSGSIFHFFIFLPVIVAPIAVPAVLVGIVCQLRESLRSVTRTIRDHQSRCEALVVAIPVSILIGHSVLYATGRMASSGEIRYMLIAAPFWAILCARGWKMIISALDLAGRELPFALVGACVPIVANFVYPVVPLRFSDDWLRAKALVQWRNENVVAKYPRLASSHPGVFYFLSISLTDPELGVKWEHAALDHPPAGTILVWDWVYALHNSDQQRVIAQDELIRAGWVPLELPQFEPPPYPHTGPWKIFLSPRDANGQPTR